MADYTTMIGGPVEEARIVVIAEEDDSTLKELDALPPKSSVIFRGSNSAEFDTADGRRALGEANVLLNCIGTKNLLSELWPMLPQLKWMHSRFAGVDHLLFPELIESNVALTNARGLFSPSLAEYAMLACLYFAKDVDRWKRQQGERKWEKFVVSEVADKTLGVLGYGDIGQACGRLAKAFGMTVLAQRRRPELSIGDGVADEVFGPDQACVWCALPQTQYGNFYIHLFIYITFFS
ncbi:unnamed protein product [Choristocarpus tenellus]